MAKFKVGDYIKYKADTMHIQKIYNIYIVDITESYELKVVYSEYGLNFGTKPHVSPCSEIDGYYDLFNVYNSTLWKSMND